MMMMLLVSLRIFGWVYIKSTRRNCKQFAANAKRHAEAAGDLETELTERKADAKRSIGKVGSAKKALDSAQAKLSELDAANILLRYVR